MSNFNFPASQTVLIDGRREVLEAIGQRCEAGVMALEDFEAGQTDSPLGKTAPAFREGYGGFLKAPKK